MLSINRIIQLSAITLIALVAVLAAAMLIPGVQLAPVRPAAAQVSGCDTCHDSWMQPPPGRACGDCHAAQSTARLLTNAAHTQVKCASCHEGADAHQFAGDPAAILPRTHFDQEVCEGCHQDQYNTFEIVARGKTFFGGSDGGPNPPKGWSKTADLPYWNVLIDGHPFVLETYEDSPMAVNQIEHQETIRPGSEACMECHGTRAAFMMGIEYQDKNGVIRSIPATKTTITLPNGTVIDIPAREYTVKSTPANRSDGHLIYDGVAYQDQATGAWLEAVNDILIPVGTKVWTYTDGVNAAGGTYPQKYQVKTLVTLPGPVTVDVKDPTGAVVGQVTFTTIASFPEAGADINGMTGFSPPAAADPNVAVVARNWIYSALEALAFDGLDYAFDDPNGETHFSGGGYNWPSVESGELCNQCHDPHSNQLRIVKKSLIAAIAARGINPYSPTGQNILSFEQASRQDQIIAVCGQCHSEYVGGYSAITKLDQDYFPWAKPADLEVLYENLFGNLQDWRHGGPVAPWQSVEPNARGFFPYNQRYPIDAPLIKVQHPEAETFLNSSMYMAGATCTDCHSARITRPDGTVYTTHQYTSPIKLMDGFIGATQTEMPAVFAPYNPCAKCHTTDTIAQSKQKIRDVQTNFNFLQERTQVALVNALKFIAAQPAGAARDANIATFRRAAMRWEYYAQAENSMGFHNNLEATTEVANARIWVDAFIPWPLTPVNVRVTSAGQDSLTLTFYDQASNETGFIIERGPALEGPYAEVARIPTPNGANLGDVSFTDVGLGSGTTYFYRVAAYHNTTGTSVYSLWTQGVTTGVLVAAPTNLQAAAVSGSQINLTWTDNADNETAYRIQRAKDAAFTVELITLNAPANAQAFSDTGLTPLTTYYYRIFAVGQNGVSAVSSTASATTLAAPPAAPTNLLVKTIGQTNMTIQWKDNASNETGFYVERSTNGTTWTRIATLPANTITYNDTGLTRRRTYWYRVQAYNAAGPSAYSNTVSAKTK